MKRVSYAKESILFIFLFFWVIIGMCLNYIENLQNSLEIKLSRLFSIFILAIYIKQINKKQYLITLHGIQIKIKVILQELHHTKGLPKVRKSTMPPHMD